jgi:uncharacterized delta-60 repeat protein
LTPTDQGAVAVELPAGVCYAAGFPSLDNVAAPAFSIIYDSVAPTAVLTTTAPEPATASPIPLTVTFSEPMADFDAADLTLANCAASGLATADDIVYTLNLTPSAAGALSAGLAAGTCHDRAGNPAAAAADLVRTYAPPPLTVAITSPASDPTAFNKIPIQILFNTGVTGFTAADLVVSGGGNVGSFQNINATTNRAYTAVVTAGGTGTVTVSLPAGVCTDLASGGPNAAAPDLVRVYDPADATTGNLDPAFPAGTGASGAGGTVYAAVQQADGKILLGGQVGYGAARQHIARINADGSLDAGFVPAGNGMNNPVYAIALQPDGKIVIGGHFSMTSDQSVATGPVARLNADGSLDTGFAPVVFNTGSPSVDAVAVQADGKILIGGNFTSVDGVVCGCMARLNADGTLDTGFDADPGATGSLDGIIALADGKILIIGAFGSWNGTTRWYVARLNADGSLDTSFNIGSGFLGGYPGSLALQPDGKILIGGSFTSFNGVARGGLARLNTDGSLDSAFAAGAGIPKLSQNSIYGLALQADGKIIIAGRFASYDGIARKNVARLNADGGLDAGFMATGAGPDSTANEIEAALVLAGGKIFVGGMFTTFNGTDRGYIARLFN